MFLRLGLETQAHQSVADADRLALMEVVSPEAYRAHLARVFGFEAPVEMALASAGDPALVRARVKSHWLRRDLEALGMTPTELDVLPRCAVKLTSPLQALGWLFVVERQTLLAGLIRRQLEHRFGHELPVSYLAAYGDTPGARFRALGEALDEHGAKEPLNPTLIVAAATEAFRCQHQWYVAATGDNARVAPATLPDRSRLDS